MVAIRSRTRWTARCGHDVGNRRRIAAHAIAALRSNNGAQWTPPSCPPPRLQHTDSTPSQLPSLPIIPRQHPPNNPAHTLLGRLPSPRLLLAFAQDPDNRTALAVEARRRLEAGLPLITDASTAKQLVPAARALAAAHVAPLRRWPPVAALLLQASIESVEHATSPLHACWLVNALAATRALPSCRDAPSKQAIGLRVLFGSMMQRSHMLEGRQFEPFLHALCMLLLKFNLVLSKTELQQAAKVFSWAWRDKAPLSPEINSLLLAAFAHVGIFPHDMYIDRALSAITAAKLPWNATMMRTVRSLGQLRVKGVWLDRYQDSYQGPFLLAARRLLEQAIEYVSTMDPESLELLVWSMASIRMVVQEWKPLKDVLARCLERMRGLQQLEPASVPPTYVASMLWSLSRLQYQAPGKLVREMLATMMDTYPPPIYYRTTHVATILSACHRMSTPLAPSSVFLLLRLLGRKSNLTPLHAAMAVYSAAGMFADDPEALATFRKPMGLLVARYAENTYKKGSDKSVHLPAACMLLHAHHAMSRVDNTDGLLSPQLLKRLEWVAEGLPVVHAARSPKRLELHDRLHRGVLQLGLFAEVHGPIRVLSGVDHVDVLGILPDHTMIAFDILKPPDVFINARKPTNLTGPVMFKKVLMSSPGCCPLVLVPHWRLKYESTVPFVLQQLLLQHPTAREMLRSAAAQ